jgi:hypothetical protein
MPSIKLEQFGGMLPAWDPHLLPVGQASYAKNGYLFSGNLSGWRVPKVLRNLTKGSTRMAFRIPTLVEHQAVAYLAFKALPNSGDTVLIGEETYTFRNAVNSAFDVLIAADIPGTYTNLMNAITADLETNVNAGVTYGKNTVANSAVKYYLADQSVEAGLTGPMTLISNIGGTDYFLLLVGAPDFGAAYNLTSVAESTSGARLAWLYDAVSFSDTTTTFLGGTNPIADNRITGTSSWLEFDDPDTNVFRSPVADDQWDRYYFASPSQPPQYNTHARIDAGQSPWLLGVPAPGCAVTLSVNGGGNEQQFGNVATGTGNVAASANTAYVTQFTATSATQLSQVSFVTNSTFTPAAGIPGARFCALLYSDNAGVPGTLLNFGQVVTGVSATAHNISVFVTPTALTPGTTYWLGFLTDTLLALADGPAGNVTNNMSSWANTFSNGPAATAPAATSGITGMNVWGDLVTTDIIEARSYVYTWVSEYGEEGPPSPPTLLNGWSNGTWTVGLWQPPADDLGVARNLKKLNLYRTVSGVGGQTVFFFVTSLDIGTGTFIDTITDDVVALNDQLKSTTWYPPPVGLQGFTVMQNGIVAGFTKNEIWFCEPYRPHAWPASYVLTVDYPIVGMGLSGGALVVCTSANPYMISGTQPSQLTQTKCSEANPCASRGSILGGTTSLSYMSPNGLIQVTPAGAATNTTDLWFTREKWQQLTPQLYGRAIFLASSYFCLGSVSPDGTDSSQAQAGFTIALDQDNTSFTIWPQPGGHRVGFQQLDTPTGYNIQNVMTDPWTGVGMVISNGQVWYFDFADAAPNRQAYTWTTKIYQQNAKRGYNCMKVFFTVPATTAAQNATRQVAAATDAVWNTLPADRYGYIKTYVDIDGTGNMVLIDVREIRSPGEVLRIVDGYKADNWQWQIMGRVTISNVQIATSVKELAKV